MIWNRFPIFNQDQEVCSERQAKRLGIGWICISFSLWNHFGFIICKGRPEKKSQQDVAKFFPS